VSPEQQHVRLCRSVQGAASGLLSKLASAQPDLVPVSTVLLMAEHALDQLAASAEHVFSYVLAYTTAALACNGVWQQLDPEKAMSLGIRALQQFGAPVPHLSCISA
jgi:hypothetical protein